MTYWSNAANQLQNAGGPWGAKTFYYDGVGNRTSEASTPVGGALTTDTYGYPATSNRLVQITRGTTTVRTLAYDGTGSLTTDSGAAGNKAYVYTLLLGDLLRRAQSAPDRKSQCATG